MTEPQHAPLYFMAFDIVSQILEKAGNLDRVSTYVTHTYREMTGALGACLFAVDSLVKGIVRAFNRTLDFIANLLPQHGFTSVNAGPQDVSAVKGDTVTSIAHLDLGGNQYHEVVMTGGESSDAVRAANEEIVQILAGIAGL